MPFVKGRSGNPGGKPRGYHEFSQACRDVSYKGVKQVLAIAENKKNHPLVRVAAWKALWERGYGRAVQPVALGLEALIRYSVTTHNRKFCDWEPRVARQRVILDAEEESCGHVPALYQT
jgi:hypothetical protein